MSYWLITSDLENQISQEVREIIPSQCSEIRPARRDMLSQLLCCQFPFLHGDFGGSVWCMVMWELRS